MTKDHVAYRSEIARDLQLGESSVEGVLSLLGEGATVPFIARYRKERTGGLDEVQIRSIRDHFAELQAIDERKATILKSLKENGHLTPELEKKVTQCRDRTLLEDIYLPYKPKRQTRATKARDKGLAPLAEKILAQDYGRSRPEELAASFIDPEKEVATAEEALKGASDILAEQFAEDAAIREAARQHFQSTGVLVSKAINADDAEAAKYRDYFDFAEPVSSLPSHRILALRRGEKEGHLRLSLDVDSAAVLMAMRRRFISAMPASPAYEFLSNTIEDAYKRLLSPSVETDTRLSLKQRADDDAITVFAHNLRNRLLESPLGTRPVLAVDPGFRTGCKLAVIDSTGRFIGDDVIFPHTGAGGAAKAAVTLRQLIEKHGVGYIALGNGTASRETETFLKTTLEGLPERIHIVVVNEAGASVYSASEVGGEEFPDLDATVRGAISIGRRLQDPLAELVKIDPKSIGVGQYQHDVNQAALKRSLGETVESCVNFVGVDLNTASRHLLSYVSGIGDSLARAIVDHRDSNGRFSSRKQLLKVKGFGAKAFQQAAGFLRIREGESPLDNTGVHPESYSVVEKMAERAGLRIEELIRNGSTLSSLRLEEFVDGETGLPTLHDIVDELEKPGRDPRDAFQTPEFREDVHEVEDLEEGMVLEGKVTNVTQFGAFVDIGVHRDGLVHVSELSHRYVENPAEVVQAGQIVKVMILTVDKERNRIGLSMKAVVRESEAAAGARGRSGR
ncbi:MAG: Tex family protein [Planctomycetota bacterium]